MVSLCTNFPTHFWSAILVTKWLGFVPYLVWHDRFTMKWDDLHNICLFCKAWDCRRRTMQANYHQGTYNVQIIQSIFNLWFANLLSIFRMFPSSSWRKKNYILATNYWFIQNGYIFTMLYNLLFVAQKWCYSTIAVMQTNKPGIFSIKMKNSNAAVTLSKTQFLTASFLCCHTA